MLREVVNLLDSTIGECESADDSIYMSLDSAKALFRAAELLISLHGDMNRGESVDVSTYDAMDELIVGENTPLRPSDHDKLKTLSVSAKCSDLCAITYPNGKCHDGYVPEDIGIGGGDYIEIEIDIDTGKVVDWSDAIRDKILALQAEDEETED